MVGTTPTLLPVSLVRFLHLRRSFKSRITGISLVATLIVGDVAGPAAGTGVYIFVTADNLPREVVEKLLLKSITRVGRARGKKAAEAEDGCEAEDVFKKRRVT